MLLLRVCGVVVEGPHIPHLVKGISCTRVQTKQKSSAWGGKRRGVISPSLPTFIKQDPTDVVEEVGEEEGGGRELFLYKRLGSLK